MQGNNPTSNPQGNNKTPSLSWSQPAVSSVSTAIKNPMKPPMSVSTPPLPITAGKGRGMLVGTFVAGLIVGILVGWAWFMLRGDSAGGAATSTATLTTSTRSTTINTSGAKVETTAQPTSGTTIGSPSVGTKISVSGVKVTRPTWVVVYDNNNGVPGNALGAKLFGSGVTSGTITLLRATRAGVTYLVGLNVDNGDGKFSKQSDAASGEPTSFIAK